MSRRKPYSKVNKTNEIRAKHVKGMGDVVFKGFQCLNPDCTNYIFVREDSIGDDFQIKCPVCGYIHKSGGETVFYNYSLDVYDEGDVYDHTHSSGKYAVKHKEYISEAKRYKYCLWCSTLKPLELFGNHKDRKSKHQGECKMCKDFYNSVIDKNGVRLPEQHAESSQSRRLMVDVTGSNARINRKSIEKKYGYKCFCCGKDLSGGIPIKERPIDHTLPVYYLWPYTTDNATLLCFDCNEKKKGKWPSEFYNSKQLKELSVLTGYDHSLLSGKAVYNDDAIKALHDPEKVDKLIVKYAKYMERLIKLRNRLLNEVGYDFFSVSIKISKSFVEQADSLLKK